MVVLWVLAILRGTLGSAGADVTPESRTNLTCQKASLPDCLLDGEGRGRLEMNFEHGVLIGIVPVDGECSEIRPLGPRRRASPELPMMDCGAIARKTALSTPRSSRARCAR